jgi:phosphopantetheinyl transferase (holo-ACP synthase)
MLGNDVIDLRDPDSDPASLSPRFDARVFRDVERDVIGEAAEGHRMRWSLWAAKEASYKLARKRDRRVVFSPIRFEVSFVDVADVVNAADTARPTRAAVSIPGMRFDVTLEHGDRWIHAIARCQGEVADGAVHAVGYVRDEDPAAIDGPAHAAPSRAVRALACRTLAQRCALPLGALSVHERGRIPSMLLGGSEPRELDLSLSHHGDFVAFACVPRAARGAAH